MSHPPLQADTWPLASSLELGAWPTAVPCAGLHARLVATEWGLETLAGQVEILVSELVTDAVRASAGHDPALVRFRMTSDTTRIAIQVWDSSPVPPTPFGPLSEATPSGAGERDSGRVLMLSSGDRWDWYPTSEPEGKVVWCELTGGPWPRQAQPDPVTPVTVLCAPVPSAPFLPAPVLPAPEPALGGSAEPEAAPVFELPRRVPRQRDPHVQPVRHDPHVLSRLRDSLKNLP